VYLRCSYSVKVVGASRKIHILCTDHGNFLLFAVICYNNIELLSSNVMEFFKTYALLVIVLQAKNSVLKFDFSGVTLFFFSDLD